LNSQSKKILSRNLFVSAGVTPVLLDKSTQRSDHGVNEMNGDGPPVVAAQADRLRSLIQSKSHIDQRDFLIECIEIFNPRNGLR
jgi:hypothetical protein